MKICKEIKIFDSGSISIILNRMIETEEDVKQFREELDKAKNEKTN